MHFHVFKNLLSTICTCIMEWGKLWLIKSLLNIKVNASFLGIRTSREVLNVAEFMFYSGRRSLHLSIIITSLSSLNVAIYHFPLSWLAPAANILCEAVGVRM